MTARRRRSFGRAIVLRSRLARLLDARRLPATIAQVVQLRTTNPAAAHDRDRVDGRRVDREDPLDADAARHLADREGLADATALARDAHALEGLQSLLVAFAHAHVHAQRVAGCEIRQVLADLRPGSFL